jgi:hypothetical protein
MAQPDYDGRMQERRGQTDLILVAAARRFGAELQAYPAMYIAG